MEKGKLTHSTDLADSNDPTQPSGVEPEEAAGAFRHTPFQRDNEIRLVKLQPAGFHEPIACSLVHSPFGSTDHPYHALSYTWGCAEDQVLIQVNGKPFSVTHNAATALRYLRKNNYVTIWIDAICINQRDEKEKSDQVALMTQIYRLADEVIIWLGPAKNSSNLIMEFFESSAKVFGTSAEEKEPEISTTSQELISFLMRKSQNRLRRALEALLQRKYWYRAWVVPEIIMAKEIILMCGSHSASWNYATAVVDGFVNERAKRIYGNDETGKILSKIAETERRNQARRRDVVEENARRKIERERELERLRREGGETDLLSDFTIHMCQYTLQKLGHLASFRLSPDDQKGPRWLLEMLIALRHFKSKDPRDKIFSVLGLINRELFRNESATTPPFNVDYGLEFLMVSTKLFQYYLSAPSDSCNVSRLEHQPGSHRGCLNILCASQPTKSNGFPSWLADFSRDNGMEPWPIAEGQYLDFKSPVPYFSQDQAIIYVPGVRITVLQEGCVNGKDDDSSATDPLCLLSRIWAFMGLKENIYKEKGFWEALVLGHHVWFKIFRSFVNRADSPESMFQALEDRLNDLEAYVLGFLEIFRRTSLHRRFAIFHIRDEGSFPAMVPAASQPGDTLFLLWGCEYPVLLREKDNQKGAFDFIGPCWIPRWWVKNDPTVYGPSETIELH